MKFDFELGDQINLTLSRLWAGRSDQSDTVPTVSWEIRSVWHCPDCELGDQISLTLSRLWAGRSDQSDTVPTLSWEIRSVWHCPDCELGDQISLTLSRLSSCTWIVLHDIYWWAPRMVTFAAWILLLLIKKSWKQPEYYLILLTYQNSQLVTLWCSSLPSFPK